MRDVVKFFRIQETIVVQVERLPQLITDDGGGLGGGGLGGGGLGGGGLGGGGGEKIRSIQWTSENAPPYCWMDTSA